MVQGGTSLTGALLVLLTAAGCAQSTGGQQAPQQQPQQAASEPQAEPAAAKTAIRVDRSFWYAGFKVTLGEARLSTSAARRVAIDATFQNLGTGAATPTDELVLSGAPDTSYPLAGPDTDLPEVPALRSGKATIVFDVDDTFQLADGVLTVGEPQARQAVVPLARPDGLIALEPQPFPVRGKVFPADRTDVFLTLTGGEVRSDDPYQHDQAPSGSAFVRLTFTATNTGPAGMTYVFDRDLTLIRPDGTETGNAGACSRAQVHVESHATVRPPGPACFAVPVPAAGTYRLVWGETGKGLRFSIG